MIFALNILLLLASLLVCVPIFMFCLEVALSLPPKRQRAGGGGGKPDNLAVLIPAHNESLVLGHTLQTLMPTLPAGSRVLVVADNCSDNTAEIARQQGAEALERFDSEQRGKGFALKFGLAQFASHPPAVVVFLDADCQVEQDTVNKLGAAALASGRPVQALYLCDAGPAGGPLQAISAFAFRFKNLVRMLGLSRLAGLCHLTGAGMALPWPLVSKARLDGNVVEDMQWGIDLALAGHLPLYLPEARVDSPLPLTQAATTTQRTRWEHGHLSTLLGQVPRLLAAAIRQRRLELLCLALDLAIPPLALLVAFLLALLAITALAVLLGGWVLPAMILAAAASLLGLAIAAGWFVHCRTVFPLGTLLLVPLYVLRKLPIYGSFLWKRQQTWVRTERDLAPRA